VKHTDIGNSDSKIYAVKNEWNYVSLCGAGRYGYDFENRGVTKDEAAFSKAVEAFEKADTIKFNSMITNEEALILQRLKEKNGYKLINEEARSYAKFLVDYSEISGTKLYGGDLESVRNSNFVISVGSALKTDNPNARFAFNNSMSMNKGAGLYFHPISDPVIDGMGKSVLSVNYAPLQEEAVLYLILDLFADKEKLPSSVTEYLSTFHSTKTVSVTETIKEEITESVTKTVVDEESGEEKEVTEEVKKMVPKKITKEVEVDDNSLIALIGADESFEEKLEKLLAKKDSFSLILGEDLYNHQNSRNLARLAALIEKYSDFEIVIVPPKSNSLGVALICDLDDSAGAFTIGYNEVGNFTLSALGDGDLDMPAFNQQEGTLTSINKRVKPTNAAVSYGGYVLNDIANALGLNSELTVDYTQELPKVAGYRSEKFDDLPNYYKNSGEECIGYTLDKISATNSSNESVETFDANAKLDGTIIYLANPVKQFSKFSAKAHQLEMNGGLYVSENYLKSLELSEGDLVNVKTESGEVSVTLILDNKIDGNISYLPTFDTKINSEALFDGYRFNKASIKKV
jgi:NADH-quinone oxidoreductase subunit G